MTAECRLGVAQSTGSWSTVAAAIEDVGGGGPGQARRADPGGRKDGRRRLAAEG